jgi:DNA-binding MarR family transcriptional regulator
VPGQALKELRQSRPFAGSEVEASVNLLLTAEALLREIERVLKPAGISQTQYNVLRILRGAGAGGLSCCDIGSRMITRDPDITRLLDRLERRGLVRRARSERDRRVVRASITPSGLKLLRRLDRPMLRPSARLFGRLGPRRLRELIAALEDARAASG